MAICFSKREFAANLVNFDCNDIHTFRNVTLLNNGCIDFSIFVKQRTELFKYTSLTNVEVFVLMANDLKSVVTKFRWQFLLLP